jgi:hypothetical protein
MTNRLNTPAGPVSQIHKLYLWASEGGETPARDPYAKKTSDRRARQSVCGNTGAGYMGGKKNSRPRRGGVTSCV